MARIRFKNPEWAGFSSYMGTVKFVDGVSEGDVSAAEIRLLGSITAIEVIEEDGSVHNGGLGQENVDLRSVEAPDVTMPKPDGQDNPPVEITPAPEVHTYTPPPVEETEKLAAELENTVAEIVVDPVSEPVAVTKLWTRDELEAIADESGIKGVREKAGDALGVKSNSIEGLINEILHAQTLVSK